MNRQNQLRNIIPISLGWEIMKNNWKLFTGLFIAFLIIISLFPAVRAMFHIWWKQIEYLINPPEIQSLGGFISVSKISLIFYMQIYLSHLIFSIFIFCLSSIVLDCIHNRKGKFNIPAIKIIHVIIVAVLILSITAGISILCQRFIRGNIGFYTSLIICIFLRIKLMFFVLFIANDSCNPLKALYSSWILTNKKFPQIVLMLIVCFSISFLGFVVLGIGFIYTIPLAIVIWVCSFHALYELQEKCG